MTYTNIPGKQLAECQNGWHEGEAFFSVIITRIDARYAPQLAMLGTELVIQKYDDCILSCDPDRLAECLQNLIENALKYRLYS